MALDSERNQLENVFKVKLVDFIRSSDRVVFDVTPDVSEDRTINYSSIDLIHLPGQIFVYKNSTARTYRISARLISRSRDEATSNLQRLQLLRTWTMPRFGRSSTLSNQQFQNRQNVQRFVNVNDPRRRSQLFGRELLGAPPAVLAFSAYSSVPVHNVHRDTQILEHINKVPVVISQLSIPYPSDVDYIPTTDDTGKVPMPTIMTIDIGLDESHSPREYSNFSLDAFKAGRLPGF